MGDDHLALVIPLHDCYKDEVLARLRERCSRRRHGYGGVQARPSPPRGYSRCQRTTFWHRQIMLLRVKGGRHVVGVPVLPRAVLREIVPQQMRWLTRRNSSSTMVCFAVPLSVAATLSDRAIDDRLARIDDA